MKKAFIAILIAVVCVALLFGGVHIWLSNLRILLECNVILANDAITISEVAVNENNVYITGELNVLEHDYLDAYIIGNTEAKKSKNTIYIRVLGGYGTGEENKRFTIDERYEGEEITRIILKGRGMEKRVIWEKPD